MSYETDDGEAHDSRQETSANVTLERLECLLSNPLIASDENLVKEIAEFEKKLSDPIFLHDNPEKIHQAFSQLKINIKTKINETDKTINLTQHKLAEEKVDRQKNCDVLKAYDAEITQQAAQIDAALLQKPHEKQDAVKKMINACQKKYEALSKELGPYHTLKGRMQRRVLRDKNKIQAYDDLEEKIRSCSELIKTLKAFQLHLIAKPDSKFPRLDSDEIVRLKKTFEEIDAKSALLQKQKISSNQVQQHKQTINADIQKHDNAIKQHEAKINHLTDSRKQLSELHHTLSRIHFGHPVQIGAHRKH